MNIRKTIRNEARLDSRRFAKSTVCRIVYDGLLPNLLSLAQSLGVIDRSIPFLDANGYSPVYKAIVVVPVTKINQLSEKYNSYLRDIEQLQNQNTTNVETLDRYTQLTLEIKNLLMQTLQVITLDSVAMPGGMEAGLDPKYYDIAIEQDTRQITIGRYIRRNKT